MITYKIQFNPTSNTWCLFKHIVKDRSYNFYAIFESTNKKECIAKLKEVKE